MAEHGLADGGFAASELLVDCPAPSPRCQCWVAEQQPCISPLGAAPYPRVVLQLSARQTGNLFSINERTEIKASLLNCIRHRWGYSHS